MSLNTCKLNYNTSNNHPYLKYVIMVVLLVLLSSDISSNIVELTNYGLHPAFASLQSGKEYEIDSLFVALLTNGDASIDYNLVVKTNKPSTNVTLFGQTVHNLTLTDYNDTNVIYQPTVVPNQITVFSQKSPDIHVTYTTSDLVDKQNRNWTFSFSFPDKFLLKMPSQAHITHMEPPPFLTPTDDQNLWGFGPGNVKVSYVIGPLGTRQEAQASIRSLEEGIKVTRSNYNGIILTNITHLLENARSNFKQGKYLETVTQATNALDMLQNTGQSFITARDVLSKVEGDITNKRNNGYDTSRAEATASVAKNLYELGDYRNAENTAKQAISQTEAKSGTLSITNSNVAIGLGAVGVIAVIILVIYFVIRKRNSSVSKTLASDSSHSEFHDSEDSNKEDKITKLPNRTNTLTTRVHNVSPIHFMPVDSPHDGVEIKDYLAKVVKEVDNVRKNREQKHDLSSIPLSPSGEQSIKKELLVEAVSRMKIDKPYLRNEDKELLDFLCEREGSAFESEIRNKFVLPRTSLWRLIKRLEREELVEVRKIGGQNLIKLRFEDRST
ncbi:MAG TPA: hypothetical protein VJ772_01990 [Nitrososphaeraceae archaeon]|nr:hypothetical protein [Nitrososphaeraceae archaeon]